MKLVIILFSIYAFLESISYAIYEYQEKENKFGAVSIFILSSLRISFTYF